MPIYEYECCGCGHRLEAIQSVADGPLTDCPVCEQPSLKRLVSAAAFRLKGGGWYETDFKSGNRKNVAGGSEKTGDTSSAQGSDSAKGSDQGSSAATGSGSPSGSGSSGGGSASGTATASKGGTASS